MKGSQDIDSALALRVAEAGWALAAADQQDMIWGHVAIRDPAGRGVWMKSSGWSFDEIEPEDVLLVDWNGVAMAGTGTVHVESHIHLAIMQARPDVNASVHTHPQAVNAFSALDLPLRAVSHEGIPFVGPQIPRSPLSGDLVGTSERGAELAEALGHAPAMLMPRHGLVAVGGEESEAVMHAVLLDKACSVMLQTLAAGELRSWSDPQEVADKQQHAWPPQQIRAGFDYLVRLGGRGRSGHRHFGIG